MSSLKNNLIKALLRLTINRDPAGTLSNLEKKHQKSVALGKEKLPKGFVVSKEQTPSGTKFQRLYKEGSERFGKIIYYLHGGAYISGLLSTYLSFAAKLSVDLGGCEVILLDYRCAPEYKYPSQFNEAMDLWNDLTGRQGYNPKNIIIGGDSAGGNLTLSIMLKMRDIGMEMPKATFCVSAWADMTGSGESFRENFSKDVMFGRKGMTFNQDVKNEILSSDVYCYVGDADRTDPYVSPVYGDYNNFSPMFFTAGEHEMLLSDTYTIVKNFKKNNVPADYDVQSGMYHIYTLLGNRTPESAVSYRKILDFIKNILMNKQQDCLSLCVRQFFFCKINR